MFDATSTFFVVLSFSVRLSLFSLSCPFLFFFFFNDTATTEIYTLSLHDALPISTLGSDSTPRMRRADIEVPNHPVDMDSWRSEEHTSELQSLRHLVCRLLLEKKKKKDNIIRENKINAAETI